ncbi:MAG: Fe-S cluster assembly protein NifU [Desulfovibrionaceae bacterium]|nr:Fe-S cluster assembly protein NifU [Desulfovibrionaceae bacterium]
MWDYSQAVHDHFLHPHNAGPLADANAVGEVGSLACGDALRLYLKISPSGIIEKAGFETFGCASAIASSSVLTDIIIGMSVDEALKLTNKDIVEKLGGLPREKMHCSVMGQEALEAAIRNWRGEPPIPHAQEIGKLVCKCFGVTDAQIIRTIRENNLTTVEEVTNYTKAGGGCGECLDEIAEILAAELAKEPQTKHAKPKLHLTNVQRMQKVMAALDRLNQTLTPSASVELVDVEGVHITVHLEGIDKKALLKQVSDVLQEAVQEDLCVQEA